MKERARRCGLMVLAMLPIASVAFAAQAALSSDQIGKIGISAPDLAKGGSDSHSS